METRRTPFLVPLLLEGIRAFVPTWWSKVATVISSSFVREKSSSPPRFHGFRMRCARWRVFSRVKCRFLDGHQLLLVRSKTHRGELVFVLLSPFRFQFLATRVSIDSSDPSPFTVCFEPELAPKIDMRQSSGGAGDRNLRQANTTAIGRSVGKQGCCASCFVARIALNVRQWQHRTTEAPLIVSGSGTHLRRPSLWSKFVRPILWRHSRRGLIARYSAFDRRVRCVREQGADVCLAISSFRFYASPG